MRALHQFRSPMAQTGARRYIDLGGQAVHIFQFAAPVDLAYEYFCDVPAVFELLPDALSCYPYAPDRYRLIVGATDGHGHNMAAVFDLYAHHEPGKAIRIHPAKDGPPLSADEGLFHGSLSADAFFRPGRDCTLIEYAVEIDMSIPVPNVLRMMPTALLQSIGERTMSFKMTQMINGFTRGISNDFHLWANGVV
ncbi:DUF1997 domain-containing protein [Candidatus Chloroploca mongolica]|nr:DUF1997 domain-containing protein [Candidatus Chloroploca mongolica]